MLILRDSNATVPASRESCSNVVLVYLNIRAQPRQYHGYLGTNSDLIKIAHKEVSMGTKGRHNTKKPKQTKDNKPLAPEAQKK